MSSSEYDTGYEAGYTTGYQQAVKILGSAPWYTSIYTNLVCFAIGALLVAIWP